MQTSANLRKVKIIRFSATQLQYLIFDIMDFHYFDRGQFEPKNEEFGLLDFFREVNELFDIQASGKGLEL